jgi:hypothetical protein
VQLQKQRRAVAPASGRFLVCRSNNSYP